MFPLHYPACGFKKLLISKTSKFFIIFKSSYQLHVPVQLPCYDFVPVKNLPTQAYISCQEWTGYFGALKASLFPDRDGRFVQNSRTCSPQLVWFAITGDSIFTRFKLQKAIRTEKTFILKATKAFFNWYLHCSKCVAQPIQAITVWRNPHFHLIMWAVVKEIYTRSSWFLINVVNALSLHGTLTAKI